MAAGQPFTPSSCQMVCPVAKQHCTFCSKHAIKQKSLDKRKNAIFYDFTPSSSGLTCSRCNRFACSLCLKSIIKRANKEKLSDSWSEAVQFFLKKRRVPKGFVGHCCEWYVQPKITPPNAHLPRKFDGYLFLPEYQVLISLNFDNVDVHAFGKDSDHELPDC